MSWAQSGDGQRDFDFHIGTWTTRLSRLQRPLTGSTTWVEYVGTRVVQKVWNGPANLVEAPAASADTRPWAELIGEYIAARAAASAFFCSLPAEAWGRRGIASGNPFTVRALAYIAVAHVSHHLKLLRERYLQPLPSR